MLHKLGLLLVPMLLVAAACGGDGNNDGDNSTDSTATPLATATANAPEATATIEAPESTATPIVIATQDFGGGPIDLGGASNVLSSVNPFRLLDSFDGASSFSTDVDPALKNELLAASDLPSGFLSMGEFTFAAPSEYGEMQMAANIFASGDITSSGELGTMVMSASIAIPPGAMDEFGAETLDEIRNLSDEDLASALGGVEGFGAVFSDLRVLDGAGLGDGGVGMHMVMDFSGMMDAFGAPTDGANPFEAGIAVDMYMFVQGDHLYMTMVMWPAGGASGVDARRLAGTLDARAGGGSL